MSSPSGKLVECLNLENGLKIEIWDHSRVLAGDRWLVSLEARIDVPLEPDILPPTPDTERLLGILNKAFGKKVSYIYKQERHFVDEKDKDSLFEQFMEILRTNVIPYLSHKDFARRLVMSKLRELRSKEPRLFF